MSHAQRVEPPRPARYAKVLFGAAAAIVLALFFSAETPRVLLSLAAGGGGSLTLWHFARACRRAARAGLERGRASRGRIVEEIGADGSCSLSMPASGTEPWGADSFILWVAAMGAAAGGVTLDRGERALLGLLAALLVVLALRLASAPTDRLRFEVSGGRWSVAGLSGGRPIHRSGSGPLLPQLAQDALVLWSSEGRVGVLRGELEPEERAWLAERLGALAGSSGPAGENSGKAHQCQADRERHEQESEGRDE